MWFVINPTMAVNIVYILLPASSPTSYSTTTGRPGLLVELDGLVYQFLELPLARVSFKEKRRYMVYFEVQRDSRVM